VRGVQPDVGIKQPVKMSAKTAATRCYKNSNFRIPKFRKRRKNVK
jgi:hypothetical protein